MLSLPMGVGKSKLAVDLIGEHAYNRMEAERETRVLILCPLSVVGVWRREFDRHSGQMVWLEAPDGSSAEKQIAFEYQFQEARTVPVVCVCHYDAAWREPLASWLLAQKWNFVVADESHKFKAMPAYKRNEEGQWEATSGKLAAFMAKLGERSAFRLALTGTPMAHSPADIFSQFRFLDHGKRFGTSAYQFKQRYAKLGGFQGKEVVGWAHQEEMSRLYNEIAWTCPSDVIKLPEAVHDVREFDLSTQARQAYAEMWAELCAKVEEGEITAQNGAVAFLRLQQITSGIGRLDDGRTTRIDYGKELLLKELLEDLDPREKVVVFCQFRDDIDSVKAACEAVPGRLWGEISGTSKSGLTTQATYNEECNTLAVQLQSGGTGIDLTAARYCVYFTPGLSLANYEQSLKRVHRPGQERPVFFLHLNARGTVDTELYERLAARKDLVEGILEMARKQEGIAA